MKFLIDELRSFGVPKPRSLKSLKGMWLHLQHGPNKNSVKQGQIIDVDTKRQQFRMQTFDWFVGASASVIQVALAALEENVVLYFSDEDMRTAYDAASQACETR